MLGNDVYFYDSVRKYISIFGSLFNDLVINRFDSNGNLTKMINVPIRYAGKEKMLERVLSDPDINRQDAIILPAMSFEWITCSYRAEDKQNTVNRYFYPQGINGSANTVQAYNFMEVPYTFMFNLYIYFKTPMDGNKILEQILPFFTPDFTVNAYLMPGQPSRAIPIVLMNVAKNDDNSEDFKQLRVQIFTLSFNLKGFLWGPVKRAPLINFTNTSFYAGGGPIANTINVHAFGISNNYYPFANSGNAYLGFYQTSQPGMLANGSPTSNISLTLPPDEINPDDDFDVITITYPAIE